MGLLDLDLCGPSIPTTLKVTSTDVVNSPYGWIPLRSELYDIAVMSIGFLLPDADAPVTWRGPRKTGSITRSCAALTVRSVDTALL